MGKQWITFACGCEGQVNLFGPHAQRDRVAARLAQEVCQDCYNKKAAEEAIAQGLPPLKGSPKQIAWAESIRQDMLRHIKSINRKIHGDNVGTTLHKQTLDFFDNIMAEVSASVWIDKYRVANEAQVMRLLESHLQHCHKKQKS